MLNSKDVSFFAGMAALGAVALSAPTASANLISCATGTLNCSVSSTENFTANFNATTTGGSTTAQLEATALFENFVFSNNGTELKFDMVLTNTTPQGTLSAATWDSIRLTALGFNTQPDATGVAGTSSPNDFNTFTETNFPSFMTVDICESSGSSSCPGGGGGGLSPNGATNMNAPDHTSTISLDLTGLGQFTSGTGSIDLGCDVPGGCSPELYDVKFQTGFGSFEFQNTTTGVVFSDAPEPASLALLGTALGAFGLIRRRRKSV